MTDITSIPKLNEHPIRRELDKFLVPDDDMYAWHAKLVAMAWEGDVLWCFFRDNEAVSHALAFFPEERYRAISEGFDMRTATVGKWYEVHVKITEEGAAPWIIEDSDVED